MPVPERCFICGDGPHEPTPEHDYWALSAARAHHFGLPSGPEPSMTAAETLDPREAPYVHTGFEAGAI